MTMQMHRNGQLGAPTVVALTADQIKKVRESIDNQKWFASYPLEMFIKGAAPGSGLQIQLGPRPPGEPSSLPALDQMIKGGYGAYVDNPDAPTALLFVNGNKPLAEIAPQGTGTLYSLTAAGEGWPWYYWAGIAAGVLGVGWVAWRLSQGQPILPRALAPAEENYLGELPPRMPSGQFRRPRYTVGGYTTKRRVAPYLRRPPAREEEFLLGAGEARMHPGWRRRRDPRTGQFLPR